VELRGPKSGTPSGMHRRIAVVIGLLLALGAGRLIASQLFGLSPTDVSTLLLATLLMVAVSAAAGYLPARRASRVDPNEALRYE